MERCDLVAHASREDAVIKVTMHGTQADLRAGGWAGVVERR
jgi:hypothetical protein